MDAAAPTAPAADAPMHDRPPSDGSPASPAAAARAAADPVPFTLRTSNDNFEVAGFGQVGHAPIKVHRYRKKLAEGHINISPTLLE